MAKKKYDLITIGIDQSYTGTGIGLAVDGGKLKKVTSLDFKGLSTRSEKRKHLTKVLNGLIIQCLKNASQVQIICERIRTFSGFGNKKDKSGGLKPSYLIMTGALVAVIVDTAYDYGIPVYSVDTRAWKSKIVGSSKSKKDKDGKRDAKGDTVKFVEGLGFDLFVREKKTGKNKGDKIYNDDAADAGCMALYGFIKKSDQNLKLEE